MSFTELPQEIQERFHWAKPDGPREPFYAAGQRRPKIRLFWQKSSRPGLLSSPASCLLSVISVLDDSPQREQDAHRDEERFIVRAHEKLTELLELQRAIHELAVNLIV